MNVLTPENIEAIGNQVHPDSKVHPTSAAYIKFLVEPYAKAIETATVDGIQQWLPLAFPGEMAKHARTAADKMLTVGPPLKPEKFDEVYRSSVIDYLVAEILELAGNNSKDERDPTILPWDVQKGIGNDDELSQMFGIAKDQNQLPVEVEIGTQTFTHQLTLEFVAGLLLSGEAVPDLVLAVSVFGVPFNASYIVPNGKEGEEENYNRFSERRDEKQYTVLSVGGEYGFDTPDFMQGFATVAMWDNVDHRKYWSDLAKITRTAEGDEVFEKLSF